MITNGRTAQASWQNTRNDQEQLLGRDVHKMIEEQHELLSELHQMNEEWMRSLDRNGNRDKDTERIG